MNELIIKTLQAYNSEATLITNDLGNFAVSIDNVNAITPYMDICELYWFLQGVFHGKEVLNKLEQ